MNDLIKTGKKVFTFAVVFTTIVWSIGVGALALPLTANAVTSGDLIKGTGTAVYYYGADAKRYVFPYQAAYSSWYGSTFSGVTTMTDADLIAIPFGGNVTVRPGKLAQVVSMDSPWMVMDPKVYAVEKDNVLRWVKTADVAVAIFGATWESQIVAIPEALLTNYTIGAEINAAGDYTLATQQAVASINECKGLTGVSGTGGLSIALASDTPAAASVPKGAANVYFTKVNFTAGAADATITGLKVTRSGLGIDANLSAIKLFVDGVQRGTSQSLGSVHQATFSLTSNPIVVSAGTTKAVVLGADIAVATAFDQHVLGIALASDITTTATVSGTFPVNGNTMSLVNTSIGSATISGGPLNPGASSGDVGIDPAAVGFRFSQIRIAAGSTEPLVIEQITAIKNGTAANTDVKNIELFNDTAGTSLGTVTGLDSNSKAVFSSLNLTVAKGAYVELSIKADMAGGSGRTIGFDVHDGTSFAGMIKGGTFNFGIAPTFTNTTAFCDTGVTDYTCQRQTINQGYLTVSKSASAPATGKIPVGGTNVSLMAFDFTVAGEPINVTQTIVTYTTADGTGTAGTGIRTNVTNFTLVKADGTILAGPKDGDTTHTSVGAETLTVTDGYTLPIGTTVVYAKANLSTNMTAGNTIVVSMAVTAITGKGANSGKTTYTTSTGAVVPPATAITGNTMTLQGPVLAITTAATPVVGSMVINAQDQIFAYLDLDASAGGENIRVSSVKVTDTCVAAAGPVTCTLYTGLNNLELWGDPDNTDATVVNERLATSNSTATNGLTTTFTFQTPIVVSKTAISRLTLKADVTTAYDADTDGTADTHAFNVAAGGDVTAIGATTGNTASKSVTGAGQAQTLRASGTLKVEKAADMPSAAQLVSSSMANEVAKYKFTTQYEPVDVTTIGLYCGNNAQAGTACTLGNIAKLYVYADGALVGNTSGYTLDANGRASVVLDSGTLVIPKDSYKTITLKADLPDKTQVTTSSGAVIQIGIECAGAAGTTQNKDNTWADAAGVNGDYWIIATGQSSGATIDKNTINSVGTTAVSQNFGSNGFSAHKGILTVSLNASSPSGTQTAGSNKEVLRLNLTATGDDVTIRELELKNGGTATITGTDTLTVKSDDLGTTYATLTGANCNTYSASANVCLESAATISIGIFGCTVGAADGTGDLCAGAWTTDNNLQVAAGTTKVIRIFGDTTGALSTKTYQMTVGPDGTNMTTVYGVTYRDSSGTDVGDRTGSASSTYPATKNLPLSGGSLSY
ncbi:hypothetical protein HZB93_00495 [Candidatus Falkowbacteria bacterium]|nr:hypothetical protein [Candidatus Falkowbacteria bacterium]